MQEPIPILEQEKQAQLRWLGRRESWLWLSTFAVTLLMAAAFALLAIPPLLHHNYPIFRIDPARAVPALMALALLFNTYAVHKQWLLRRRRRQLTHPTTGTSESLETDDLDEPAALDPVTGLPNRRATENWLAKQMATARRKHEPLTLLMLYLNELPQLNDQYGSDFGEQVLREFAEHLKRAIRGCDLAAHLGGGEFLSVLPGCGVDGTQHVLGRLSPFEVEHGEEMVSLDFSTASVDYQTGELPSELLKRAEQMIHLYKKADQERPFAPM